MMLYERVYNTITKNSLIPKGATVIAALSGGADSVCLVDILYKLKDRIGFTLECAHLNHNLRGDESDGDEQYVKSLCKTLGLTLHTESVDVAALAQGRSLEEAARDARYGFFKRLTDANGAIVATAHTLSDNAETFFINLLRGSGGRGLCGIPQVRGNIIRPMLDIKRSEIISHLDAMGLSYRTDSTNADTAYLRNFIRHEIMPRLESRGDVDIYKSISKATENLKRDSEALDAQATAVTDNSTELLGGLSDAVLFRVLTRRLKDGFDITLDSLHFEKVKALLNRPSSKEQIRGDVYALNRRGRLEFVRLTQRDGGTLPLGIGENRMGDKLILIKNTEEIYSTLTKAVINCDKIVGRLYARTRRDGDIFFSARRSCTTRLKKLLINDGVPLEKRNMLTVICDGSDRVVFVEGYGADARYIAGIDTDNKLCIEIQGENQKC